MVSKKKNYYAVAKGRKPGIYECWDGADGAKAQVMSFPGAVYKGHYTLAEAEDWMVQRREGVLVKSKKNKNIQQDDAGHVNMDCSGKVVVYTDGGCSGNPGPGGYGVVILKEGQRKELSGGYRQTTNNRMELMACVKALESLDNDGPIMLFSDSSYVVNGITRGWAKKWRKNNWIRNGSEKAENVDLWSKLLDICERLDVQFVWVRGHAGTEENERCDCLAVEAAAKSVLSEDVAYETGKTKDPE